WSAGSGSRTDGRWMRTPRVRSSKILRPPQLRPDRGFGVCERSLTRGHDPRIDILIRSVEFIDQRFDPNSGDGSAPQRAGDVGAPLGCQAGHHRLDWGCAVAVQETRPCDEDNDSVAPRIRREQIVNVFPEIEPFAWGRVLRKWRITAPAVAHDVLQSADHGEACVADGVNRPEVEVPERECRLQAIEYLAERVVVRMDEKSSGNLGSQGRTRRRPGELWQLLVRLDGERREADAVGIARPARMMRLHLVLMAVSARMMRRPCGIGI